PPQLCASVGIFSDNPHTPLKAHQIVRGADYPTRMWTAFMKAALDGEPVEQFPDPADLNGTVLNPGHTHTPDPGNQPTDVPTNGPDPTDTPDPTPTHTRI